MTSCILHIGLHKTGSTSIQSFLQRNRERLSKLGVCFYRGSHIDQNHVELHAATMRDDRSSTFKMKSEIVFDDKYKNNTSDRIRKFLQCVGDDTALFSAEGLSLLRYVDETKRLATMLPANVRIAAYQRNPADYLKSHKAQLERAGITGVTDKNSNAYMGADTWLIDYKLRLQAFETTFGKNNIHIVDYDEVCAHDGNVIPSFLRLLELEKEFAPEDWQYLRLNQS